MLRRWDGFEGVAKGDVLILPVIDLRKHTSGDWSVSWGRGGGGGVKRFVGKKFQTIHKRGSRQRTTRDSIMKCVFVGPVKPDNNEWQRINLNTDS